MSGGEMNVQGTEGAAGRKADSTGRGPATCEGEGRMRILLVEPEKRPVETEIESSLDTMQRIVGGLIQAVYPFEEPVALICNDDGKRLGLPLNRALFRPESRQPYDVVAGSFFLCGAPPDSENFESLTDEQIRRYQRLFAEPEQFIEINGQLLVIKMERRA